MLKMNNYFNYRILLPLFAITALCIFYSPAKVYALTISPTRIEVSGNPGETLKQDILLINENDDAETLYPSYANFEASGDSGTPAFVQPKDDLGTWMTTDSPSVLVSPGQQKSVSFKIN